jgi:kumamolisin
MSATRARAGALLGLLLAACAPAAPSRGAGAPQAGGDSVLRAAPRLSLQAAMREGRDLGPLAPDTVLHLTVALASRDTAALDALTARGVHVTSDEYVQRFAPAPATVEEAVRTLAAASLTLTWHAGDQLAWLDGSAASVQRFFAVAVHDFATRDGGRFHAPLGDPTIPASVRAAITSVVGLDDWTEHRTAAVRSPRGVTPQDVMSFYNLDGLRGRGIDGSGLTVVLPEIDSFADSDLAAYAAKYHLPPFHVDVHRDRAWGDPKGVEGEANLDLEIVHALAPAAKLVVYYSSPKTAQVGRMMQAMYSQQGGPRTIVSSSIGICELPDLQGVAQQEEELVRAAAAKGTSIFAASGDRGAYDCLPEGDPDRLATDLDGGLPSVTSVGGTTVFLGQNGGYGKETAWGQPVEQWGGNGGLSIFWPRPDWQRGPGVDNQYANGMRQTPDVSGNADGQSGWNIISGGAERRVGGTSAAAPMWAAITALIDQVLLQQHHQTIGFANPGLYWMAQNAASLPAPPFHDVTVGTNLYYPATPGWDFATGLGTPDAGALALDWPKYMEAQGR